MIGRLGAAALVITAAVALAGAAGGRVSPAARIPSRAPRIAHGVSLLTYNVKGLPWPVAGGRVAALQSIAATLRSMHLRGDAPDIAVVQEAFTEGARKMIHASGYRYAALGSGTDSTTEGRPSTDERVFADAARWSVGETEGKFVGSGLAIMSDYPILRVRSMTFPHYDCAGYDCLAAKGAMIATIATPDAPGGIDVLTTHLNSRGASGVPAERADAAWKRQFAYLTAFIARTHDARRPLIVAGDLNVGSVPARRLPMQAAVRRWTAQPVVRDALRQVAATGGALDRDARWSLQRARDWQLHFDGADMALDAVRITTPFGRDASGSMLSDHVGYVATYRLRPITRSVTPTA